MSRTVTSAAPKGSDREILSSVVMPIRWAVSTILSRPIAWASRTGMMLIDLTKAVVSDTGPE